MVTAQRDHTVIRKRSTVLNAEQMIAVNGCVVLELPHVPGHRMNVETVFQGESLNYFYFFTID
jgi:hypothetical protein